MPKVWKTLPQQSDDLIGQLLVNRLIKTEKQREIFFNPSLGDFEMELKISGIEASLKRIHRAIDKGELIIIYGDFDVDGICATTILYKGLTSLGAKVLPYIPHREKEGYGLSKVGLEFARDSGAGVIITVDNGIVAFDEAKYAKELGLDLIITDHHIPLDKKPAAFSIVHSTDMCGAAVAWCLIQEEINKNLAQDLLQFVAVATVADLIPLVGLNRCFVKSGLKQLNKTTNIGLKSLILESKLTLGEIGSYEIGHIIAPRLNAIGRLEHAIDAVRLLCTKDLQKAARLSKLLSDTNTLRQKMTIEALEEARLMVSKKERIHILDSKNWSMGIIGLIAGRVCEEYSTPAIAISVGETISKGSARSINGINIVETIRQCSDILIGIGGHPGAAGFSIANENIPVFKKRLAKLALKFPWGEEPVLEIEAQIPTKNITRTLVKDLEKFEPFGLGNPKPVFATYGLKISDIKTVGLGKHLKFKVADPERSRGIEGIDAIAFGMGNWAELLKPGQLIDVAYYLELNKFNGSEKLQLKVKDIKI
ncbi:single-stranded-DNA-specific exonuclease RecJ [Candidatus Daviesbacteria bacterium]|nr:single-stranded-DNA-specific exonuclease RecJ [Candidatus Daviesbacteria bacterium]